VPYWPASYGGSPCMRMITLFSSLTEAANLAEKNLKKNACKLLYAVFQLMINLPIYNFDSSGIRITL
jgi:hypothetical protein